jgi:hypothetical protein
MQKDNSKFEAAIANATTSHEELLKDVNHDVLFSIFHAFAANVVYFNYRDFVSIKVLLKKTDGLGWY